MQTLTYPTLIKIFWPAREATPARHIALAIAGSLALWLSAKIQVPFYPVPMTMQTFVILVIGMAYGWRLGMATILLYLAEGALGLPVFAGTPEKGIGIAYMIGPTGGYLLGFVVATAVVGWLAQQGGWDRHVIKTFAAMIVGTVIIYTFGVLWLGMLIGWEKPLFSLGVQPFLYADLFKMVLASILLPLIWKRLGKRPNL